MQPGGRTCTDPGHLGIFLRRGIEGSAKEEESEFGYLIYVEAGNNVVFSRTTKKTSTAKYQRRTGESYRDLVPLSVLEVQDSVNVGAVIYFKAN